MTLFHYDHCPYCVKARMIFGLKAVPVTEKVLLNDDEDSPISMIGQKMLPILQTLEGAYLPESLEIISYVDSLESFGPPRVGASKGDGTLNQWLLDIRKYHYALAMPRWVAMNLPEFATASARQYFTIKKERSIGPFSKSLSNSKNLINQASVHLSELEKLIVGDPFFWGDRLSIDDFHVFASLRCLTTVKGFNFPEKIETYMNEMSEKSKVPLHWDLALGETLNA